MLSCRLPPLYSSLQAFGDTDDDFTNQPWTGNCRDRLEGTAAYESDNDSDDYMDAATSVRLAGASEGYVDLQPVKARTINLA